MPGAIKVFSVVGLILFCFVGGVMSPGNKTESQDGEFTIEMVREGTGVKIMLHFVHPDQYSHCTIEKNQQMTGQFRQCAYIDLKKVTDGNVEARDKYPFSKYEDSYYRIRTVTNDMIERVYPPVQLPAGTQLSNDSN